MPQSTLNLRYRAIPNYLDQNIRRQLMLLKDWNAVRAAVMVQVTYVHENRGDGDNCSDGGSGNDGDEKRWWGQLTETTRVRKTIWCSSGKFAAFSAYTKPRSQIYNGSNLRLNIPNFRVWEKDYLFIYIFVFCFFLSSFMFNEELGIFQEFFGLIVLVSTGRLAAVGISVGTMPSRRTVWQGSWIRNLEQFYLGIWPTWNWSLPYIFFHSQGQHYPINLNRKSSNLPLPRLEFEPR